MRAPIFTEPGIAQSFVLFITMRPMRGGVVGWSAICQRDAETGRPFAAQVRVPAPVCMCFDAHHPRSDHPFFDGPLSFPVLSPRFQVDIDPASVKAALESPAEAHSLVSLVIHEIIHALGFEVAAFVFLSSRPFRSGGGGCPNDAAMSTFLSRTACLHRSTQVTTSHRETSTPH